MFPPKNLARKGLIASPWMARTRLPNIYITRWWLADEGSSRKVLLENLASEQEALSTGNACGRNQELASVPNNDSNRILLDLFHKIWLNVREIHLGSKN